MPGEDNIGVGEEQSQSNGAGVPQEEKLQCLGLLAEWNGGNHMET